MTMNIERLELLITVLEGVSSKTSEISRFNMSDWIQRARDPVDHHVCGTSACALGWAALDPRFQEQGLTAWADNETMQERVTITSLDEFYEKGFTWGGVAAREKGRSVCYYEFFGITGAAADYLFMPSSYEKDTHKVTPQDVIEHVREVIAVGGKHPIYVRNEEDEA